MGHPLGPLVLPRRIAARFPLGRFVACRCFEPRDAVEEHCEVPHGDLRALLPRFNGRAAHEVVGIAFEHEHAVFERAQPSFKLLGGGRQLRFDAVQPFKSRDELEDRRAEAAGRAKRFPGATLVGCRPAAAGAGGDAGGSATLGVEAGELPVQARLGVRQAGEERIEAVVSTSAASHASTMIRSTAAGSETACSSIHRSAPECFRDRSSAISAIMRSCASAAARACSRAAARSAASRGALLSGAIKYILTGSVFLVSAIASA